MEADSKTGDYLFKIIYLIIWVSQLARKSAWVKNLPAMQETQAVMGVVPRLRRSPEGGYGNPLHYSCLENPSTEEAGGLQSTGLHRVR